MKTKNGKTEFGVWDQQRKCQLGTLALKNEELPQDEKYHPYSLGIHEIPESGYIFAHVSCLLRVDFQNIFSAKMTGKKYEIVVMVKAEGPSYVKGSAKENSVSIERVLLLEPKEQQIH